MNKLLLIIFVLMMIASPLVFAQLPPLPTSVSARVTFNGEPYFGTIYVKELRLEQTLEFKTNEKGYMTFVLSNYFGEEAYRIIAFKDTLRFSIFVGTSEYYKEITLIDGKNRIIYLNYLTPEYAKTITEYKCQDGSVVSDPADCPEVIITPTETKIYVCWDKSQVFNPDSCPEKPVEKETLVVCEDGTLVNAIFECPEEKEWINWIATISIIIVALLALYAYNKKKYGWAKGFSGIMSYYKKEAEKAKKDKNPVRKKQIMDRATKTAATMTEKYLKELK